MRQITPSPQGTHRYGGVVTDPSAQAHPTASAIDRVRLDPRLRTRDESGIIAFSVGTLAWAIAWLVVTLATPDAPASWPAICVVGCVLGIIGVVVLLLRRRRIQRSRSAQE